MDIQKILIDFMTHLNNSGVLKKGTMVSDEVKYYLENKGKCVHEFIPCEHEPIEEFDQCTKCGKIK